MNCLNDEIADSNKILVVKLKIRQTETNERICSEINFE